MSSQGASISGSGGLGLPCGKSRDYFRGEGVIGLISDDPEASREPEPVGPKPEPRSKHGPGVPDGLGEDRAISS